MSDLLSRLENGIETLSANQTELLAQQFAEFLPENTPLALFGDLGTGKTTFTKALLKAQGVKEEVNSPSYNIYISYKGTRNFVHMDAYRLKNPQEAEDLLIEEFLNPPWNLIIEWPEKVLSWLPKSTICLSFCICENKKSHLIKKLSL